jgi:hypothetical protein
MRWSEHCAAWRFVVVVLSLVLAGCDGYVNVRGAVRNSRGEPIAGAKIHVTNMDQYWRTESRPDGCFDGGGTTDPMHSSEPLTVVAPGYKTASAKVRTGGTHNQLIVTLALSDSAAASQIQLLAPDSNESAPCTESK